MSLRPLFRHAARLEFERAATWYERQRPGLGQQFVTAIGVAIEYACDSPDQFPIVHRDIRCIRIRRFPYSVYFRTRSDRLVVLGVFHARRNPMIWRSRR